MIEKEREEILRRREHREVTPIEAWQQWELEEQHKREWGKKQTEIVRQKMREARAS